MKANKYKIISVCGALLLISFLGYALLSKQKTNNTQHTERKVLDKSSNTKSSNPPDNSFANRIISCTNPSVLEFINNERILQGKNVTISPGEINNDTRKKFVTLYNRWPEEIKRFAETHISFIYIVKDLGSSGYTTTLNDFFFLVFIDERILSERPNDWFNRTEKNGIDLKNRKYNFLHIIEAESENQPVYTLENILIHEIGHCVGVIKGITPTFIGDFSKVKDLNFYNGCFKLIDYDLAIESKYRKQFGKLSYYSNKEKISCEEYINILNFLKDSPFPTTYSTRSSLEFFAEYFYSYVHCTLQKKPFAYNVYKKDKLILSIGNGIYNNAAKEKNIQIEKIVKNL